MSSPPTALGQYQIIREIARSNDIVYEAYDPLMNRRVAIKELAMPPGSTPQQQEDRISRFKREAQAAGTLSHANIMTVYSFAEDAGRTFMAMEFLDGQTLRNEIDTHGALPPARAIEIACAVLSGLEHAHSKGVIHRDIKPDNIQLLTDGSIKITDFGIARLTFQPNLTMDGQVFGTPSYMSPEQVVGREIDARSDLFSVGVVLYEMLTGTKPFSGDSVVSTTYAIMNKEADQPPNITWGLWSALSRSLEKSPQLRYSSAADMRAALQDAMQPQAYGMPAIDPVTPPGYLPASNPYGVPAPPIVPGTGGPSSPGIPIQAPYNPYGAPDPNANPYGNQYGAPPQPLTFSYNPYQQGPGGPTTGPFPNAFTFNPPAPRTPLFKAETVLFVKKMVIALLLFATLTALLYIFFASFFEQLSEKSGEEAQQEASVQFQKEADDAVQKNMDPNAELGYQRAEGANPQDPSPYAKLGDLYVKDAQASTDPEQRATLFEKGADQYKSEVQYESDPAKRRSAVQKLAGAAGSAAQEVMNVNDSSSLRVQIRTDLEAARTYAQGDDTEVQRITDLISQLRI
jgi:serine/threonine-protein kinase